MFVVSTDWIDPTPKQGIHQVCRMTLHRSNFLLFEVTTTNEDTAARIMAAFVSREGLTVAPHGVRDGGGS